MTIGRTHWMLLGATAAGALLMPASASATATVTVQAAAGALTDGPYTVSAVSGFASEGAAVTDGINNGSAFGEVNSMTGQSEGFASADYFGSGEVDAAFDTTITNATTRARLYKYKFTIDAGGVDVEAFEGFLGGDAVAEFSVQIFATYKDTTALLFETSYQVEVDDGVTIANARTGTDIGYIPFEDGRIGVSWNEFTATVSIPFAIDPGTSFDFQYLLSAAARADGTESECGYGTCGGIGALANVADPGQISSDDLGFSSAEVPAPGAAILLGAGLAGIAGRRRRR